MKLEGNKKGQVRKPRRR